VVKVKGGHPLLAPLGKCHLGLTVWFTGLSGSGKSTLSRAVADLLRMREFKVRVLDADELRRTFCAELGFTKEDRDENVLRIGNAARDLTNQGTIALVAVIAPYRDVRDEVRRRIGFYMEVFVDAPLQVCIERDPKGLYMRAQSGEIPYFTGISAPYERPNAPEVICRTDAESIEESAAKVLATILDRQYGLRSSRQHAGAGPGIR
jgi:adenylylsulfate kinase